MFDFTDKSTNEYVQFALFVDETSNKPKKSSQIDKSVFPNNQTEATEQQKIFYKENFLSEEECEYLLWISDCEPGWDNHPSPFWNQRTIQFFTTLQYRKYSSVALQRLSLQVYKKIEEFVTASFGETLNADSMQIVRSLPSSFHPPHIDAVDGLDRVAGCTVFLNDNYEGGETFYPLYGKIIKPQVGAIYAHDAGANHMHGSTMVKNNTSFTLFSTWTRNLELNTYGDSINKMTSYLHSCGQAEQPITTDN